MFIFSTQASQADSTAKLIATPTSTAIVTVRLDIESSFGGTNDVDVQTVSVTGLAETLCNPSLPPWNLIRVSLLNIALENATYEFDFFCFPFVGCQHLDVSLENVQIILQSPVISKVPTDGAATFLDGSFKLHADYTLSGLTQGNGSSDTISTSEFAGVMSISGSNVSMKQCRLSPLLIDFPKESLPGNVSSVRMTITSNLSNLFFQGSWIPEANGPDLNGDGVVNGVDLSFVLSSWGTPSGDINGDQCTDREDLTEVLSAWKNESTQ
jgi:hypothetical protein